MVVTLPTEKNKPKSAINEFTWLIYGPPGIGKTTFANHFPDALILACEPGTKHLESYTVPIGTWKDLQDVYSLLKGNPDHVFKTVVFDTVDILYRLCVSEVCTARKIEHPSDEAYGKGADMVRLKLIPLISAFTSLGLGVVFVSHEKQVEVKENNRSWTKTTASLPGAAASVFVPLCDIVGHCHFDDETQQKRQITFKGSKYLDAKARTSDAVTLPGTCDLDFNTVSSFFGGIK